MQKRFFYHFFIMALLHSFEKSGNFLFKHRGIVPVFVFLVCLPVLIFSSHYDYWLWNQTVLRWIIPPVAILLSLSGIAVRAYTIGTTPHGTSGRNTDKQVAKSLNTNGIYSIVRHPLYLGNYLMWAGLLVFIANIPFFICVSLIYWLYYERIMFAEERFLERQFGQEYLDWSMTVPAFWPRFRPFKKGDVPFHFRSVLRREYPGIFAITLCFTLVDYFRAGIFFLYENPCPPEFGNFQWNRLSGIVCVIVFLAMIVLRTLKHHSKLLAAEENRD